MYLLAEGKCHFSFPRFAIFVIALICRAVASQRFPIPNYVWEPALENSQILLRPIFLLMFIRNNS